MISSLLFLLLSPAAAQEWSVAPSRPCNVRKTPSVDAPPIGYVKPGVVVPAGKLADGWVSVTVNGRSGWLGPECKWAGVQTAPEAQPEAQPEPGPEVEAPVCPEVEAPTCPEVVVAPPVEPGRPSFGGVFMGRSATADPYLGEGGQLSVGGIALLRVEGSGWLTGFSAAYMGGSRFQRQVVPFAPGIGAGGKGIGNVASIYTDVRQIPIASLTGYGWELWRVELLAAAGPSAHRFSVRRREQVSGVSQKSGGSGGDAQQEELTTYTVDRLYDGESKKWALGATAVAGALMDAGNIPFVQGRWRVGVLGTVSTPLGRQGCSSSRGGTGFGTVCVPLAYEEVRRSYFTEGKESTDRTQAAVDDLLLPVSGLSWSVNSTLMFEF